MEQLPSKQVYDLLRHSIENGLFPYGSAIPSERVLAENYMVSRTTVRKAIDHLIDQGLLYRVQGKGTFVSLPRLNASNAITSTRKYLEEHHLTPSTIVFFKGIRKAGYKYSRIFQIPEDAEIYQLFRQRCGNSIPYSIEYTYLPMYVVPNVMSYDFSTTSLYQCFQDNHLTIKLNHQTLDLVTVSKPQSTLLGIQPGESAFMRKSSVYDDNNRIIEYTLSYSVAEKYVFEIN